MTGAVRLTVSFALAIALTGCGDDSTRMTPEGPESTGEAEAEAETVDPTDTTDTSDTSETDPSESDTGDTSDTSDTGEDETGETGDTGDTGEPEIPQSSIDMAAAAVVTYSPSYTMVLTVGQPTINQNSMASPSYKLEGGTVRITGTTP